MPCQNSEFDRDYRCMLYLLHREVRSYLLEKIHVQPPHEHHLHFLDFNEIKTACYFFCGHLIAIALFYFISTMAANPAQSVPPVAQQPQPPLAQQPYKVLPVLAGPYNKTPLGGLAPILCYCSGDFKHSTTSISSILAISTPVTSRNVVLYSLVLLWLLLPWLWIFWWFCSCCSHCISLYNSNREDKIASMDTSDIHDSCNAPISLHPPSDKLFSSCVWKVEDWNGRFTLYQSSCCLLHHLCFLWMRYDIKCVEDLTKRHRKINQ